MALPLGKEVLYWTLNINLKKTKMTTIVLEQEYFINVVTILPILSDYYHYYFCSILVLVHSVVIWSRIQARELEPTGAHNTLFCSFFEWDYKVLGFSNTILDILSLHSYILSC